MKIAPPAVSIILTTCDRPKLFHRAYISVLKVAGYSSAIGIELLVVNDSKRPCEFAASTLPNLAVHLIDHGYTRSLGVARARNLGISKAKGEYLLFLDDDDFLEQSAISSLLSKAQTEKLDLVYGNVRHLLEDLSFEVRANKDIRVDDHPFEHLQVMNFIATSSYMIRKNLLVEGFDPYLDTHEDWAFLLANSHNIKHGCISDIVSNITFCDERSHRNLKPDENERLLSIFEKIYARYPSRKMQEERDLFLTATGKTIRPTARPLEVKDCGQLSLLVINPEETIQSNLLNSHVFERFIPDLAADLLNHSDISGDVLDVGAAIGSFAITLSGLLHKPRKIHCFECQKSVFLHLCANILINRQWENIEPYLQALADTVRDIQIPQFDPFEENYTGSVSLREDVIAIRKILPGVAEPMENCHQFGTMKTLTIDQLFSNHQIALIKIDSEGMEPMIISGALKVISHSRPYVIAETWASVEFKSIRDELCNTLWGLNYRIFIRQDDLVAIPAERSNSDIERICNTHQFLSP